MAVHLFLIRGTQAFANRRTTEESSIAVLFFNTFKYLKITPLFSIQKSSKILAKLFSYIFPLYAPQILAVYTVHFKRTPACIVVERSRVCLTTMALGNNEVSSVNLNGK